MFLALPYVECMCTFFFYLSLSLHCCLAQDCRNFFFCNVNQVTGYFVNCMKINARKGILCKMRTNWSHARQCTWSVLSSLFANSKNVFFWINPYSVFEANFRFSFSHSRFSFHMHIAHTLSFSLSLSLFLSHSVIFTLLPRFSLVCFSNFPHFLGATWCLGVWFFWMLFAFIAFGQLANFSMTQTECERRSNREKRRDFVLVSCCFCCGLW